MEVVEKYTHMVHTIAGISVNGFKREPGKREDDNLRRQKLGDPLRIIRSMG